MSVVEDIIARAEPLPAEPPKDRPWEYEMTKHVDIVRKAVGNYRDLVWGSMVYACQGSRRDGTPGCGHEHRVLVGVGVEGPPALKAAGYTIPSPFYCGTCPACGGSMAHARWQEDEEYDPRPRDNDGSPHFRVPGKATLKRNAAKNYHGADYVGPDLEFNGA